jgi:hypothetical protein
MREVQAQGSEKGKNKEEEWGEGVRKRRLGKGRKKGNRRMEHEVIIWRNQTFQKSSVTAAQPPEDVNKLRWQFHLRFVVL